MKKILPIVSGFFVTLFVGFIVVHAQDYTPLAPLPGTFTGAAGQETTTLSTYLAGVIKLSIALGAGFAILMAIIGGTQYVASGISPSAKNDAKDRILNAFIGLALVLTSYLILNSINPDLVNFKLELPLVGETTVVATPQQGTWPDDSAIRAQLLAGGVPINKSNCTDATGNNCTSVAQLPSSAINGVIALKSACVQANSSCSVTLTGGTEGGHQTHGLGKPQIDLSAGGALDTYITKGRVPVNPQGNCGLQNAPHYNTPNGTYVLEAIPSLHWHVCY